MKFAAAALLVFVSATSTAAVANAEGAGSGGADQLRPCIARVVYSEEIPFAPIDNWHVNVTLEVTPRNGRPYYTAIEHRMSWQGPPPRRGQAFRVWCDPARPNDLHLMSRPHRS